MEIRELLKRAFRAGQKFGDYRSDRNFNDWLNDEKEALMLYGVSSSLIDVKNKPTFDEWKDQNCKSAGGGIWKYKGGMHRYSDLQKYYKYEFNDVD